MKILLKKSLAIFISVLLIMTITLPCFTMISIAETTTGIGTKQTIALDSTFKDSFTLRTGENPAKNGMTVRSWSEAENSSAIKLENGIAFNDSKSYADASTQYDKYITTMINENKRYRNFEMKIQVTTWNGVNYLYPGIMFGVNQPEKWASPNAGWVAGLVQNGQGVLPAIQGYDAASDGYKISTEGSVSGADTFYGLFWYYLTVRVEGTTATFTVNQPDNGNLTFTSTVELPSTYTGGYVGLMFRGATYYVWAMEITDLGGEVIIPDPEPDTGEGDDTPEPVTTTYDWSNETSVADFKSKFNVYSAVNPDVNGMTAMTFEEAESANQLLIGSGNGFSVKPKSDWKYQSANTERNKYLTTVVDQSKKYRNFEMSLMVASNTGAQFLYPSIMFGVNDPTKFATPSAGWATGIVQDVYNVKLALEGYDAKTDTYKIQTPEASKTTGFYGLYWYWLTVKVEDDVVTVSYTQPDSGARDSYTFKTPEAYTGGYVGLMFRGDQYYSWKLNFTDLGGTVEEPAYTEVDVESVEAVTTVVPVGSYGKELNLPSSVKATASDGNVYDMYVDWNLNNYDRFNAGEYTCVGTLSGRTINGVYVFPAGKTATATIKLTGESITPIKVACVGDSITYGDGVAADQSYPSHLQELLGGKYIVENFGVCGATASSTSGASYQTSAAYTNSLKFDADIIIIKLGTNDAWDGRWGVGAAAGVSAADHFKSEYIKLIDTYIKAAPDAKIYLATPATYYGGASPEAFASIISIVKEVAAERGYTLIDINTFTANKKSWFPDTVHPSVTGYYAIANEIAKVLLDKEQVLGDIDGDGIITKTDEDYMNKMLLKVDGSRDTMYDINGDGVIDVKDAILLKKSFCKK